MIRQGKFLLILLSFACIDERRCVERRPVVRTIDVCQIFQLPGKRIARAAVCAMREIDKVQEIEFSRSKQQIMHGTDGIAAIRKYELMNLAGENRLQHRFPESADVRTRNTLGGFKALACAIERMHVGAERAQQLNGRVFAHIAARLRIARTV